MFVGILIACVPLAIAAIYAHSSARVESRDMLSAERDRLYARVRAGELRRKLPWARGCGPCLSHRLAPTVRLRPGRA